MAWGAMSVVRSAAALLAALVVAACNPSGTGYVEIKAPPGLPLPVLHLDSNKIETIRGGVAVLSQKAGPAKLQYERDGRLVAFCELTVRRDRIVTVTVSALGREPRCRVQN